MQNRERDYPGPERYAWATQEGYWLTLETTGKEWLSSTVSYNLSEWR